TAKMISPTRPPTSVPLMRIYCRARRTDLSDHAWRGLRFLIQQVKQLHSRARFGPGSANVMPERAQGMPGARPAPMALCAKVKSTQAQSPQVKPFIAAFPARWCYG